MGTLQIEEFEGGEAKRCDGPIRRRRCGQENPALSLAHGGLTDFSMPSSTRGSYGDILSLMNVWMISWRRLARCRTVEVELPRLDRISEHDAKV